MTCDQCNAARINGVFCHEHGCPNSRKQYVDGQWIRFKECSGCGNEVALGEVCECQQPDEDQDGSYENY